MSQVGVDTSLAKPNYPNISADELAKLWKRNYQYFETDSTGKQLSQLYTRPNLSPIHSVLGSQYTIKTKAGWIGMTGYHAANDAGIISTPKGDYVVAITTNADGKLDLLNDLVSAINKAYLESKNQSAHSLQNSLIHAKITLTEALWHKKKQAQRVQNVETAITPFQ